MSVTNAHSLSLPSKGTLLYIALVLLVVAYLIVNLIGMSGLFTLVSFIVTNPVITLIGVGFLVVYILEP